MKRIVFVLFCALLLSSCGKKEGTLYVERSIEKAVRETSFEEFSELCGGDKAFVAYLYSEECYACYRVSANFFPQFLSETYLKVYAVGIDEVPNSELSLLGRISSENAPYFSVSEANDETYYVISYPLVLIVDEGRVLSYALGANKINRSFFSKNLLLDSSAGKYSPDETEILHVESNPSGEFLPYREDLVEGIVYHTTEAENNAEIEYYLAPLLEIGYPIYLDENGEKNDLEIVKGEKRISAGARKNYLPLLDAYVRLDSPSNNEDKNSFVSSRMECKEMIV